MPPDPSLFNLVATSYKDHLFSSGIDVLNILAGQIEQTILSNEIAPHLYIGIQSFSAFELFAAHYSTLASKCQKISVFGTADKQPRQVPNTEFIALPEGSTLTRERFIIVNHPSWQVMLLAQEDPQTADRWERQRLYNSIVTFAPTVVERCNAIAAMLSGNQPSTVGKADSMQNQQHIAQFIAMTATMNNLPEFDLSEALTEVPDTLNIVQQIAQQPTMNHRLSKLASMTTAVMGLDDVVIYRNEDKNLRPVISTRNVDNISGAITGQGPIGTVAQSGKSAVHHNVGNVLGDPGLQAAYVVPIHDTLSHLWGVAAFASRDANRFSQPTQLVPFSTLTGIMQAITYRDSQNSFEDPAIPVDNTGNNAPQPMAQAPMNYGTNGGVAAPASTATSTRTMRSTTKGRIRLGPRRLETNTVQTTVPSGTPEIARLPQVEAKSIQEDPMAEYQRRVISHLLRFDRHGADRVWREAYARFPARDLCVNLLQPVLIAVGEGWHRGQVSVAAEHFTTSYVESKIIGFLNSYPDNPKGATIITGCAQGETHETGIMMLSLFLRWEGNRVIYLGANVPNSTLAEAMQEIRPDLLCLSATMKENANNLMEVGHIIHQMPEPRPIFGFGGAAFIFFPELRTQMNGMYLGDEPNSILKNVREVLEERRQKWG